MRSFVLFAALVACLAGTASAETPKSAAEELVSNAGVTGGLVSCLDYGDGKLTRSFAESGKFIIHGLSSDRAAVAKANDALDAQGLAGIVSVEYSPLKSLPYPENLVNAIVCEDLPALVAKGVTLKEIVRALCPNGVACLGLKGFDEKLAGADMKDAKVEEKGGAKWLVFRKPRPAEMDVWTHWNHAPDGNLVSEDKQIGLPKSVRWMAGPFLGSNNRGDSDLAKFRAVSSMVSNDGRNYLVMKASDGDRNVSKRSVLAARDAFNGTLLWTREFPTGIWKSNLVAAENRVFVGSCAEFFASRPNSAAPAELTALDGATGEVAWKLEKTKTVGLFYHKGMLLLLGGPLRALDAATGMEKWTSPANLGYDGFWPPAFGAGAALDEEGRLFFKSGPALTCVDANDGKVKWTKDVSDKLGAKGGNLRFAKGGIVVFRTAVDNKEQTFHVFSAKDGSWLWACTTPERAGAAGGDPWLVGGRVWVCRVDQPAKYKGSVLEMWTYEALDPATGEVKSKLSLPYPMRGDGCFVYTHTERYMIGNRPMYFMDWQDGKVERFDGARGACESSGLGLANGLLYHMNTGERPSGLGGECACNPSSCYGLVAFGTDEATEHGEVKVDEEGRLEKGAAAAEAPAAESQDSWPTYRGNALRTASTKTEAPEALAVAWTQKLPVAKAAHATVGEDWLLKRVNCDGITQATVADGRAFVSLTDAHKLVALDAKTGAKLWSFTAGGRLDTPPTVSKGLCLLGCHDGWVYALRAADGALAWRLRAAPVERRIVTSGQVESSWPVIGGVLVDYGTAYACAGITSVADGGCYVTAFDPASGKVAWTERRANAMKGDWSWVRRGFVGFADMLAGDEHTVAIGGSPDGRLDLKTGQEINDERFAGPRVSLFWWRYGAMFRRMDHVPMASDGGKLFGGGLRHNDFFDPKKVSQDLYATGPGPKPGAKPEELWRVKVAAPDRVEALAKAGDRIVVAVSTGKPEAPGAVWMLSEKDGALLGKTPLPGAPAFEGLSIADGSVFVSLQDGSIVRLGKP